MTPRFNIQGRAIGPGQPVYVIAEMSANHNQDFAQAADLLESVFSDYPDAAFLDEMLLLWAEVAFRMNDKAVAKEKLQQLIFDYPGSALVTEARKKLAGLEGEKSGGAE